MILSHSRKFILYRTKKAASSTLEQTLGVHCRTGDWVSVVYLTDEQKKRFAGSVMEVWAERQPGSTGIPYSIAPPGPPEPKRLPPPDEKRMLRLSAGGRMKSLPPPRER